VYISVSFKKATELNKTIDVYYQRVDGRGGIHLDPNPRENERLYKGRFINFIKCTDVCKLGRLFYGKE